jgi:thiamine-monophosphate kinase
MLRAAMNEFDIIAEIFAPLATYPGAFGLKDDAAAIPARPGFDLIVTSDQIAEGTDFFAFDSAASVAQKALRVNLSDLAAKGAVPEFYLLVLTLPHSMNVAWLKDFAAGLAEDQKHFGIALLGGDTASTEGPLSITVTAFGYVPQGKMLKRSGARAGDAVYVTGTIGDSAGGLAIFKREKHTLTDTDRDYLITRYRVPQPPVGFAAALRDFATASVDVSDGLLADLGHVASASGVGMTIEAEAIPRSPALRAFWGDSIEAIVRAATAGDDYQIAFTADPTREQALLDAGATRIGRVTPGQGVELVHQGAFIQVPQSGYRHF